MNFAAIPAGQSVFVDANIFVYNFGPDPSFGPPSRSLLERIEQGEVTGYVSAHVLNDVGYRLMTLEACQTFGWPYPGIGQRLRRHPLEIRRLQRFREVLDEIVGIGVQVLPVSAQHVLLAGDISRAHGLLSGDALIVAVMQSHGLTNLASSDADFDRVPGITRYAPV
jgi:predicted nucleic acid-binding protein